LRSGLLKKATESKAIRISSTMSYSNPAFAALGIKSFKLPSRNWMIFWSVLGALSGGIVYDKWQQRVLRDEYMQRYENQVAKYPVDVIHRKLRVYISPPPNDYLEESLKYFRRFLKPIINASGVDFEVITMERQGDIRYKVAEEIRAWRRSKAGLPPKNDLTEQEKKESEKSVEEPPVESKLVNPVFQSFKPDPATAAPDSGEIKRVRDLYDPMDVLGVKQVFGDFESRAQHVKYEDALVDNVHDAGGIICIGRGAYKEYINGVHEGLLGPLDAPAPALQEEIVEEVQKIMEFEDDKKIETEVSAMADADAETKKAVDEEEEEDKYAPPAYIYAKDYPKAELAPELGLNHVDYQDEAAVSKVLSELRDERGVPMFFVQPVLELRLYTTAGFTKQLERMWRFYNKRQQLIEYNEKMIKALQKQWCEFDSEKLAVGEAEESDWPNAWLKVAKKNNSEWVREFAADERVMKLMASYNCDCDNEKKENN
jgi:mitochondrial import inner membrane translocase subunit TIM54